MLPGESASMRCPRHTISPKVASTSLRIAFAVDD